MIYHRLVLGGHDVVKVDFLSDVDQFGVAIEQSRAKTPYTNHHDPAAQRRSEEEVFNAQLLGTVADMACSELLRRYLAKRFPNTFTVVRYDDCRTDSFMRPDLFDVEIQSSHNGARLAQVEIRSSVCNRIPPNAMIRRWHVLGWYETQNKAAEQKREFYMRPIYHYNAFQHGPPYLLRDAFQHMRTGTLDLYIVGGADLDLLETKGKTEKAYGLLQDGATYQTLEILKSLGVGEFLELVLSHCLSLIEPGRASLDL